MLQTSCSPTSFQVIQTNDLKMKRANKPRNEMKQPKSELALCELAKYDKMADKTMLTLI